MASFPTSAVTFAAISNGAVIQATDIGNPRDEIVAIEDGYLNGTARLNSSNSTVANLSVTGNSTFAGSVTLGNSTFATVTVTGSLNSSASSLASLQVNGTSTFVNAVTFSTAVNMARFNSFRVKADSTQNVANNTPFGLTFDTELFDPSNAFSTASSIATFPSSGIWCVGGYVPWPNANDGLRQADLLINSTTIAGSAAGNGAASGNAVVNLSPTALWNVTSTTDTLQLRVTQTKGVAIEVSSGAAMWGFKISN